MNLLTVKMKQLLCTESQGQSGEKIKNIIFIQKIHLMYIEKYFIC